MAEELSGKKETEKRPASDRPWLFQPGQSGNPGGRPKGVAAMVRARTRGGQDIVDAMCRLARGGHFRVVMMTAAGAMEVKLRPSARDRLVALAWLGDRCFGKAKDVAGDGERRSQFLIVMPGHRTDPLEVDAEVVEQEPERKLPALPGQMPEIGFGMDLRDLEEPK